MGAPPLPRTLAHLFEDTNSEAVTTASPSTSTSTANQSNQRSLNQVEPDDAHAPIEQQAELERAQQLHSKVKSVELERRVAGLEIVFRSAQAVYEGSCRLLRDASEQAG